MARTNIKERYLIQIAFITGLPSSRLDSQRSDARRACGT
jgi:hypothetical protein